MKPNSAPAMNAALYLVPKEAAQLLRVSENTLRAYRREGKVRAYRLSERVIVFKRTELEAFVARRRETRAA